jgi:Protein of unknown function (DUF4199)
MKIGTKIGIITGIILSIYVFCISYFQISQNKFLGFGVFLILIIGVISSCLLFDKETNYSESFGKIFGSGFSTTASSAFITVILTLLSYVIVPSFKTNELAEARKQYEQRGIEPVEIEQQLKATESHFYSIKSSQYLFPLLMVGALFSALASMSIGHKNKKRK